MENKIKIDDSFWQKKNENASSNVSSSNPNLINKQILGYCWDLIIGSQGSSYFYLYLEPLEVLPFEVLP
jgi:hypothetical protein